MRPSPEHIPALLALLMAGGGGMAMAQSAAENAWPCEQLLQPALSAAAIWAGPDPAAAMNAWQDLADVAALVDALAPRRVATDAATARVRAFAQGLRPAERTAKLTALFAGLFQRLDSERRAIVQGVANYHRRQEALARRIEDNWAALEATPEPAPDTADAMRRQIEWDARVFDERQRLLPRVCEQPGVLERRIFSLARVIANELPNS